MIKYKEIRECIPWDDLKSNRVGPVGFSNHLLDTICYVSGTKGIP